MKKIIVPVDFSEHSEYALETAAQLAKKNNAEIFVLHMLEISEAILNTSNSEQHAKAAFLFKLAEKRFEEFLNKDFLKGISVTPIVKHFKVFSEVNEVAKEHDVDLVIMGSQGVTGIKEIFVGSNTEKVVRYSDIPVLVVKQNPILTDIESAVFASDFSLETTESFVKARDLFNSLGIKMHLLHVNLPGNQFLSSVEMEQRIANFFKQIDGDLSDVNDVHHMADYTVEKGVLNFSNKMGADLIAIPTHGRKGLAHFFEGSISEDIANHSALPVMTFKI